MSDSADFLIEIGTEELPPRALRGLRDAFVSGLGQALADCRLEHGELTGYASPRRLAILVSELAVAQADRDVEAKGPPVAVAFDDGGAPKPAAVAFAKKCGVPVSALERLVTDKGEWLIHKTTEKGLEARELLGHAVEDAVKRLPVPRPMRWGSGDVEFVRPVHWVVMLHGTEVVTSSVLGIDAGRQTRGHRFHAPGFLQIEKPGDYARLLASRGYVIADLDERLERVRADVEAAATAAGGSAVGDASLFDEVASLVEWPVPLVGGFDERFLDLPREVVVATLTNHQRYFPVETVSGELMPFFITASNIESRSPDSVREGNERVIRPRLADAAFFWDSDRKVSLSDRLSSLDEVVYQQSLGSTGDKSRRVSALAGLIAERLNLDAAAAARAGLLSKCDLLTGMVGEFPELQGTMGRYYAEASGEDTVVSMAIGEQYSPRFAGDAIAGSDIGRCVALADKLDSLCGIFCLGKKPSGNRDPFGLRRGALGVVRTIVEGRLELDLVRLIEASVAAQPAASEGPISQEIYEFVVDRLRAYAADQMGIVAEVFDSVRERTPASLLDFCDRLAAVKAFVQLDEAASLAAANKRIGNILRQADFLSGSVDTALLVEGAEQDLAQAIESARSTVEPLIEERDYRTALATLASLRCQVDGFFDDVMVMADDPALRENRLSLLAGLRGLFLLIADISRLAIK